MPIYGVYNVKQKPELPEDFYNQTTVKLTVMKNISSQSLQTIAQNQSSIVTGINEEVTPGQSMKAKAFTNAELWCIHRLAKTRNLRRYL